MGDQIAIAHPGWGEHLRFFGYFSWCFSTAFYDHALPGFANFRVLASA